MDGPIAQSQMPGTRMEHAFLSISYAVLSDRGLLKIQRVLTASAGDAARVPFPYASVQKKTFWTP